MNARYSLARLAAVLESLPELTDRLNAAGERFERIRAPQETEVQARASSVFNRLYGDAVMALDQASERNRPPRPNELIAIEEMIRRVEGAIESYPRSQMQRESGQSRWFPLIVGIVFVGGVMYFSQR